MLRLLRAVPGADCLIASLDHVNVRELNDGGMGSLAFVQEENKKQRFGKRLVTGEFMDKDGVKVQLGVNLDDSGRLFELDVWKVDFSPLRAWPLPSDVRICE